jgi:predicted DNA-binding transcriptional regulator AlpA
MEIIDPSIAGRAHGDDGTTQLISARKVQERFAIADRTLDKWLINKSLNFPRPVYINKRKYFRMCEIFEWERQQARAHVGGQVVRPSAR